ncbi:fibrocystin-L-like [Argopecten irradians]|uniref:fibrocystin-L-like n=1 Tax=Argopecten irradians TaxID=31199 RepID=UPI00371C53BD
MFDTDTPILKMLLIQGGELVFDEKDVELKAENILITDGGHLQVGTDDEPFQHKAILTLYGHHRSKELPIYGTKSLAVREGTLDLHGMHKNITWTRLASSVNSGDINITLQHEVSWRPGDQIVISTTGGANSQSESEFKTIASIDADNKTIILTSPLSHSHLGFTTDVAGREVDFSAEVGLLTHNVVIRGHSDPQWEKKIEACPDGFDPGYHAVQTCTQGRYGEEMGSDKFGAQVVIHTTDPTKQLTTSRIEFVEFTHVGQAFRLSRHPINFHVTGDMSRSYVRGCGIHHTFNRAINIRDTYNLIVERNVIYDVNGAAIYLEDGTETGNVFQYNLGVFVKGSSQLLNDDISPATFWITNPNNTFRHNSAVGGTHFGYWIRLENDVQSVVTGRHRPRYTPLAEFNNNTAHSLGWHGVWIYPTYTPRIIYSYNSFSSSPRPAFFDLMNVWNCRKGVEVENMGAVQIRGLVAVNNIEAGYEGKMITEGNQYTDDSPFIEDSVIAGYLPGIPSQGCTMGGVISPYKFGFTIRNVTFVNFNQTNCFALRITRIPDRCSSNCGGFMYITSNLTFTNADNRVNNDWIWESVFEDMDGSLCGSANCKVVPCTGTLPSNCTSFSNSSSIPLCYCPKHIKLLRFAFRLYRYDSYIYGSIGLNNQYGSTRHDYRSRAIDLSNGWMTNLMNSESYVWEPSIDREATNVSYIGYVYRMQYGDYVIFSQELTGEPDTVSTYGQNILANETLDPEIHFHGDWQFDTTTNLFTYLISYRIRRYSPDYDNGLQDRYVSLGITKCYFKGCITPTTPKPTTVPTTPTPTTPCVYWSSPTSWSTNTLPVDGEDVTISKGVCMIADTTIPKLNKLVIYGELKFDHGPVNGSYRNFTLNVTDIIIIGGDLRIGSPNDTFKGDMDIILRGRRSTDHESEEHLPNTDIPINAKSIAVYGGLEIHGKDVGVPWTRLHTTVNPGDTTITLADNVTWEAGDEIVIAPTSYDIWETETFRITEVSDDGVTLSLNASLRFRHIAYNETINGRTVNMAAEVGLLTRNIRVFGEDAQTFYTEGRIIVGVTMVNNDFFKGNARFSNVEFVHSGLTYTNAERATEQKPSAVAKCAFHHVLSQAIGVYGTTGVVLNDNVIHQSVSSAIETDSRTTTIAGNFVVLVTAGNVYNPAAVSAVQSRDLVLVDNTVSGAYRVAFSLPIAGCGLTSTSSGNEAHSSAVGLDVSSGFYSYDTCSEISNFFIWKCSNIGIYYNSQLSLDLHGVILAENILSIYAQVTGPNPVDHLYSPKFCTIRDSLIIGRTPSYNCTTDNVKHPGAQHQVGMTFASFMQYGSGDSLHGQTALNSYPAIMGVTQVQDVTFAHFKTVCGTKDVMITTNKWNDDGQHPVETIRITKYNSDNDSYFFIHRPNIEKVNPSACVDMDCDGLKKALIKDKDGSFLGTRGAVLSQSEWEWNGDPRRGLGDYRIPRELLTTVTGERINVSTIAPYKGIIRNDECHFRSAWQAYECHDLDYEMLIIESLDADTETRRLSPVAILGDGYLDLINGPQDHSGCSQGHCRKRLSTFMAIVATGKTYSIYFSTTSPQILRLFLLNSDVSQRIILGIWYSQSNRRDVYIGEDLVLAKNSRIVNGKYIVDPPTFPGEFNPKLNDSIGANFFDRDTNTLYVLVRGNSPVKIVTNPSLIVSFQIPALTPEEFYGEALVHNLALFFDVPPEKVRIVNVVREAGRKRRDTEGSIEVVAEVGDEPTAGVNTTNNETLTTDELLDKSAMFINTIQSGGDISKALNVTITRIAVSEPPVDPELESPRADTSGEITVPKTLNISVHLNSSYETAQFPIQPCLRVFDVEAKPMTKLGGTNDRWRITAYLTSGANQSVQLHGTTTVEVVSGWANFTDLSLSHYGEDLSIQFIKTYPNNTINLNALSETFSVGRIDLGLNIISDEVILVNNETTVMIELLDNVTQNQIRDISWRGHTWTATIDFDNSSYHDGNLAELKKLTFNQSTGAVVFDDLMFNQIGVYFLTIHVKSSPEEYDLHTQIKVQVLSEDQLRLRNDSSMATSTNISLIFNESYDDVVGDSREEFGAMVVTTLVQNHTDIYLDHISVRRGSIVVEAQMIQLSNNTNATILSIDNYMKTQKLTFKGRQLSHPRVAEGATTDTTTQIDQVTSTSSSLSSTMISSSTAETSTPAKATTTNSTSNSTETTKSPSDSQLPLSSFVAIVTTLMAALFGIIFLIIICKCRKIREKDKLEYLTKTSSADSDDLAGRKVETTHNEYSYLSPFGVTSDLKPQHCKIPRIQPNVERRPFEIEHQLSPSSLDSYHSTGTNDWRRHASSSTYDKNFN